MRRVTTEQGTVAEKPWGRGRVSTLFLILVELDKMAEISNSFKEWIVKLLPKNIAKAELLFEEYLLD